MRKAITLAAVLLLGACAQDNYTRANGAPVSDEASYKSDLYNCKILAVRAYQDPPQGAGMTAAGLLGPVVGSLVAVQADLPNANGMKLSDIDVAVGTCMNKKGYAGTSN